ncbi:MAG: c-type cytochrome [Pseudomonadota bacterium]|nr:c-type cytochrome [Pseudomonadota bacterium]
MSTRRSLTTVLFYFFLLFSNIGAALPAPDTGLRGNEASGLKPSLENGRRVYLLCAVCHQPEAWGEDDGSYPQIAGQHAGVAVKQMEDIRARNRDTPLMLPFAMLENLTREQIEDVAAYIETLPMSQFNGSGPGTDLKKGARLYQKLCTECHGPEGQGDAEKRVPLLYGQHYKYLVRQFEWIRDGKRRNANEEMLKQIQGLNDNDVSAVMDYVSRLRPPESRLAAPGWRNEDFRHFVRNCRRDEEGSVDYCRTITVDGE